MSLLEILIFLILGLVVAAFLYGMLRPRPELTDEEYQSMLAEDDFYARLIWYTESVERGEDFEGW